jgi:hypothetical protein
MKVCGSPGYSGFWLTRAPRAFLRMRRGLSSRVLNSRRPRPNASPAALWPTHTSLGKEKSVSNWDPAGHPMIIMHLLGQAPGGWPAAPKLLAVHNLLRVMMNRSLLKIHTSGITLLFGNSGPNEGYCLVLEDGPGVIDPEGEEENHRSRVNYGPSPIMITFTRASPEGLRQQHRIPPERWLRWARPFDRYHPAAATAYP